MIRAIVFDFDGVILESADIKTEAFKELFSNYPQWLEEIINYHLANAGISRYIKFRYIYEKFLRAKLSKEKEKELGKSFSKIVFDRVISAPFVNGAYEFLDTYMPKFHFFIASGTPQEELHEIMDKKGITKYFKGIFGSPKKKKDIVCDILSRYGLNKNEVIYIGDAESDKVAADHSGVIFIKRQPKGARKKTKEGPWLINDLTELSKVIRRIELSKLKITRGG